MLSESDRDRVRDEMFLREEIRKQLSGDGQKSRVWSFLNSPLFVTVIAGFLISMSAQWFIHADKERELARDREKSSRDKMASVLSSAADSLSTYISTKGSWQRRKIWLESHPSPTATWSGRSRDDVYKDYADLWKMMMNSRRPEAALAEIQSFFVGERVRSLSSQLYSTFQQCGEIKDEDSLSRHMKSMDDQAWALVGAMGDELSRRK